MRRQFFSLLKFCKEGRRAVSVSVVREFLARPETPQAEVFREGLRWFWREGARAVSGSEQTQGREDAKSQENDEGRKVEGLTSSAAWRGLGGPSNVGRTSGPLVPTSEGDETTPSFRYEGGAKERTLNRGVKPLLQGAVDLGREDWERALVKAVREAGLLHRTEETYLQWARRFVRFLRGSVVEEAGAAEVGAAYMALPTRF